MQTDMRLNNIRSGAKIKKTRVGRGTSSGSGCTAGKGHKGQKARSGGGVKPGFEGGQMPLHRRLPKMGFRSRKGQVTQEIRTSELMKMPSETVVTVEVLKQFGLMSHDMKRAKLMLSGAVTAPFVIQGIRVSAGAKAAIEAAGGRIQEVSEA